MAAAAREFNVRLSLADVQHDATDSTPPVTDKGPATLYGRCLQNLFGGIPKHPIVSLAKTAVVPTSNNGNAKEFLRQFDIAYGIQDMFHPFDVLGLTPLYTPSYPFDSATKTYGPYVRDGIAEWWQRSGSPNPIVIPLYAYGVINVDGGATLTVSVLPGNEIARYQFDNLMGHTYIYDITMATRRCECPAISNNKGNPDDIEGNATKNGFFNTNRGKSGDAAFVIRGVGKLVVKLLGDYLHCIVCGPNDTVCTGDHYLRDRCVKNKKNCVYREHTGSKYNLHYTGEAPDDLRALMNAARAAARAAVRAAELEEEEQERLAAELRASIRSAKRAERTMARGVPRQQGQLPQGAVPVPPLPQSLPLPQILPEPEAQAEQRGGSQDVLKRAYFAHFTSVIAETTQKIRDCMALRVFRIQGAPFPMHDDILAFLNGYIAFLEGALHTHLTERYHAEEIDTFKRTLASWLPADILYTPNDMKLVGDSRVPPQEFYCTPQHIRKIFVNQTENIPFTDTFGGHTFYERIVGASMIPVEFVIQNPPPYPFRVFKEYFAARAEQYRDEITAIPDPKNKADYLLSLHRCILQYNGVDSDIGKILFLQLIEDPMAAARAFDAFMNLVMFRGYYVMDYDIVRAFLQTLNAANAEKGTVGYATLDRIIEFFEVGKIYPILLEETTQTMSDHDVLAQLDILCEDIIRSMTPAKQALVNTYDVDADADVDLASDDDSVHTPEREKETETEQETEFEEPENVYTMYPGRRRLTTTISAKQFSRKPTGTAASNARRTLAAKKLLKQRGIDRNTKRGIVPGYAGGARRTRKHRTFKR